MLGSMYYSYFVYTFGKLPIDNKSSDCIIGHDTL